jgi:mono/diheme cytochrome c family protein
MMRNVPPTLQRLGAFIKLSGGTVKLGRRICVVLLPFTLSACFLLDGSEDDSEPIGSSDPSPGSSIPPSSGFAGGGLLGGIFDAGVFPGSGGGQPLRLEEVRSSERAARPLSGGTLAVNADASFALAADSDRDCVYVVRPGAVNATKIELPVGSEPGRVALDASGAGHVVLRGSGKLLRIDLANASVAAETALCAQPRGVAYDAAQDAVVASCLDGEVVTLAAADHSQISRSFVAHDLRDVAIGSAGRRFVSRYRSAELIELGTDGSVRATTQPKPARAMRFDAEALTSGSGPTREPFREVTFSPTLAWRALASKSGEIWMLHQESQNDEVAITQGGYGAGCAPITQGSISRFGADGTPQGAVPIATLGLSVDVAISANGSWLAVASPGGYLVGNTTLQLYMTANMTSEITSDSCPGPMLAAGGGSQIVAVDFDAAGLLYTFSREPAELDIYQLDTSLERIATIALERSSVRDTGHELFHADVGSGLSCASCHGEALDDGHVWNFRGIGARRTQNIRGGVLGTAPFHWDGDMTSFKHLVDDVMTGRMGGFPVADEYAVALGKWIDRQPALRLPAGDAAAVSRGKELFHASATQCASCHSGEALTNNQSADVGTGAVLQVPSLRGLGLRAPFMHNGCAKTLEERFNADCGGGDKHGRTSQLSREQISDLTAFLRTL